MMLLMIFCLLPGGRRRKVYLSLVTLDISIMDHNNIQKGGEKICLEL